MNKDHTWIAMTAVTVPVPASTTGDYPAERHLTGIGMFVAQRVARRWRFRRHGLAIPAGVAEEALLERMTARLPPLGTIIGWGLERALIPALMDAANTASATVAGEATARLYHLLRGGAVDVALGRGAAGAQTLAAAASNMAIYSPAWNAEAVFSAWATGLVTSLRHDLADEALAIWRVFVRSAGLAGVEAEAATDAWLTRRDRLRTVRSTPGPV